MLAACLLGLLRGLWACSNSFLLSLRKLPKISADSHQLSHGTLYGCYYCMYFRLTLNAQAAVTSVKPLRLSRCDSIWTSMCIMWACMLKLFDAFDLILCSYNFPAALCPWLQGTFIWGHCPWGSNSDDGWRKDFDYLLERSKRPFKIRSKIQQSVKQRPRVNLAAICGWYGEKTQTVRHGETGYWWETAKQVLWSAKAEVTCRNVHLYFPGYSSCQPLYFSM